MRNIDNAILDSINQKARLATLKEVHRTLVPAGIMTSLVCSISILMSVRSGQSVDMVVNILAVAASIARLLTISRGHRLLSGDGLGARDLDRIDRTFSIAYMAFAAVLGVLVSRLFFVAPTSGQALAASLAVGYCAGVALHVGFKARLAAWSMSAASAPLALILLLSGDDFDHMAGITMLALLAGGVRGVRRQAKAASVEIGSWLSWQFMSWRDPLTGLWNRRALEGWAAEELATRSGQQAAAHVIDIDHFKRVNDTFGHQAGDDLLCQIAGALIRCVRMDDLVIRLGGDEFLVLQFDVESEEDMLDLAKRLRGCCRRTIAVDGTAIEIGLTTGSSLFRVGEHALVDIVERADRRLYFTRRSEREGSGALEVHPVNGSKTAT